MNAIQGQLPQIKERLLTEFTCPYCGQHVVQKELEIPIGPHKGEKVIANYGCICADIAIAQQSISRKTALQQQKMVDMFTRHSLINESLKRATFATYEPTSVSLVKIKQTLVTYADHFSRDSSMNLLLVGTYGIGKSHLASSITKVVMEKGYSSLFVSVPKLLTKIRQTYREKTRYDEADIFNMISKVDLFVLDDVGAEYTKLRDEHDNWTQTKIFELFDSRAGKPTIYTTNLSSDKLKGKIGGRNLSRMMGNTKLIKMEGIDYRMKGMIVHE